MLNPELLSTLGAIMAKGLTVILGSVVAGARTEEEIALFYKMSSREQFESDPEMFGHFISGCLHIALAMKVLTAETNAAQDITYHIANKDLLKAKPAPRPIDKDAN
jgi:hypothetical protein